MIRRPAAAEGFAVADLVEGHDAADGLGFGTLPGPLSASIDAADQGSVRHRPNEREDQRPAALRPSQRRVSTGARSFRGLSRLRRTFATTIPGRCVRTEACFFAWQSGAPQARVRMNLIVSSFDWRCVSGALAARNEGYRGVRPPP